MEAQVGKVFRQPLPVSDSEILTLGYKKRKTKNERKKEKQQERIKAFNVTYRSESSGGSSHQRSNRQIKMEEAEWCRDFTYIMAKMSKKYQDERGSQFCGYDEERREKIQFPTLPTKAQRIAPKY